MNKTIHISNTRKTTILSIALITGFLLFFFGGPEHYSLRSIQHLWDLGHILFFAFFTYALIEYSKSITNLNFYKQVIICVLVVFFIGLSIETIQLYIGRAFELSDIGRNISGSMLSILFFSPSRNQIHSLLLNIYRAILLLILILYILPLVLSLLDEHNAKSYFPVLSDFETPFEIKRWESNGRLERRREPDTGNHVLKVYLSTDEYSGASLIHIHRDWDKFKYLKARIYNPQNKGLDAELRINDIYHELSNYSYNDRYNQSIHLLNGWNEIKIDLSAARSSPRSRSMDMNNIDNFSIFFVKLNKPRIIFIDDVILSK